MATKRLTSQAIEAMQERPPASGNVIAWDTVEKGLGIRVTAAGAASFVLRYVIHGQERRMTLGPYGRSGLSVTAAREKASEIKGRIAGSRDKPQMFDPLEQRAAERNAADVRQLCADYIARHAEQHKRPASVRNDKAMIETIIKPKLGGKRVANVTRRDIEDVHAGLKSTSYRANRVLALLSSMFSLACKWGWRTDNPVRGVARFPEEKRTRWLQTDELTRLAAALDTFASPKVRPAKTRRKRDGDGPMRDDVTRKRAANAIRLLLLTGARRGEVLNAEWSHIDFERGVWTKPSAHTKQKREEHVPLSPPALELLKGIRDESKETQATLGRFIFPGDAPDKPLQHIKKAWASICAKAKLEEARLHDLRHTYASHLVSSGLSLPLVGRLLGHTQAATTQRYAHVADDPLREATGRMGALYDALRRPERPAGEVVPFEKPAGSAA
jgi:integrase